MKVYALDNRIILVGKAWEIRAKLKEYCNQYDTLQSLIEKNTLELSSETKG